MEEELARGEMAKDLINPAPSVADIAGTAG